MGTRTIVAGEIVTLVSLQARTDRGTILKITSCHLHNLPGEVAVVGMAMVAMVAMATVVAVTSMAVQGIIKLTSHNLTRVLYQTLLGTCN